MKKHIAAACLLGTALASAPAFAQAPAGSPAPQSNGAQGQFLTQASSQEWRGSKLVGVDVYGSDNTKIGDINEVLVDRSGQVKAIVIGVGGFLGIGEKNVAISWDKVQWNMGGNQSSGSSSGTMASSTSAGGQPAGDRSTPRDIAQTTTGSPTDPNAQPPQSVASGGATLSSSPSSGTNANAPANSTTSAASAPNSGAGSSNSTASTGATAGASSQSQDYPDRALVSMSKQDLQNAPDFHYASQTSNAGSDRPGGAGMTGTTGSTSGR
jgi:sporulation protein YlmC with PRC-barrel domain